MADLPTGTVTFLFTDIEGSTRLWEQHTQAARRALARHDELIETLVDEYHGTVVRPRGEGDSRFAVFPRASDALSAACAIQRALVVEAWPTPEPLRVRMALHTGEADLRAGDYYGTEVNRCARLRALAHGGQVLVSGVTARLVERSPMDGLALEDLGPHHLKDLAEPERVFQLLHPDLPADFPPLQSPERRHNLPIQATALLGRQWELGSIRGRLREASVRLLTLTGPGGTGKTRLSIAVAAEMLESFADGVWWVPLAPVRDPLLVLPSIAQTLGVREASGRSLLEIVQAHVGTRQMLLVLDNFEQVVAAAAQVSDLLSRCPGLKMLVTSRAALRVYGEAEFPVPPLPLPDRNERNEPQRIEDSSAVQLFVERARAVRPDFVLSASNARTVGEICARLDGLPLAIELAAARTRLLPPEALLQRLDHRLAVLTTGARDLPERQQTLRGAIAWSYDLLDPDEQRLFRRLGVFVGGATLEAIEAVCNAAHDLQLDVLDGVEALASKSLIQQTDGVALEPRFAMLETIREFALEQLDRCGEAGTIGQEHARHFLTLAEKSQAELSSHWQLASLESLEREYENVRAGLGWTVQAAEFDLGLRLAGALGRFWWWRGYFSEARNWLATLLPHRTDTSRRARISALRTACHLELLVGDAERLRALTDECLDLCRAEGDLQAMVLALRYRAYAAVGRADYATALPDANEALATAYASDQQLEVAWALRLLSVIRYQQLESATARTHAEDSLAISRGLHDLPSIAHSLLLVGVAAIAQADHASARPALEESLAKAKEVGNGRLVAGALFGMGDLARLEGEHTAARALFSECFVRLRGPEHAVIIAQALEACAGLDVAQARYRRAVELFAAAEALRTESPLDLTALAVLPRARLPADTVADLQLARARLGERDFAAAWASGRMVSVEQAVAHANE